VYGALPRRVHRDSAVHHEILTGDPLAIADAAAWTVAKLPIRLISTTARHCGTDIVASSVIGCTPAFATTVSSRPNASRAVAIKPALPRGAPARERPRTHSHSSSRDALDDTPSDHGLAAPMAPWHPEPVSM
jgi:hypothetical protein